MDQSHIMEHKPFAKVRSILAPNRVDFSVNSLASLAVIVLLGSSQGFSISTFFEYQLSAGNKKIGIQKYILEKMLSMNLKTSRPISRFDNENDTGYPEQYALDLEDHRDETSEPLNLVYPTLPVAQTPTFSVPSAIALATRSRSAPKSETDLVSSGGYPTVEARIKTRVSKLSACRSLRRPHKLRLILQESAMQRGPWGSLTQPICSDSNGNPIPLHQHLTPSHAKCMPCTCETCLNQSAQWL